jgi:uncharacterized membrane protein
MRLGASPAVRLVVSGLLGVAVLAVLAFVVPWEVSVIAGWDVALAVYVAWVWLSVGRLDAASTRAVAMTEDLSHRTSEAFLLAASLINLAGVGSALVFASRESPIVAGAINGLTVLSVSLSWAAVHTVYALRYARLFYEHDGGIRIDGGPPDYGDFAYVAFTIGMTYQVSDTTFTTKRLRRVALGHTLLSYLFGAVIGATVINVVVGLFRG